VGVAVELEVTGNGNFAGAKAAIDTYRVTEDSTPIEASDSTGGTGQITFTAVDDPSRFGSMLLFNDTIKLTDSQRGDVEGKINEITSNDRILAVTADSRLGALVVDKQAAAVNGTFLSVVLYYLGLCGVTTNIGMETSLSTIPVIAPGWQGDVWTKIKELCVTLGVEVTQIRTGIVFRPVRSNIAVELNNVTESWTISNSDLAQEVEIYYYNTEYRASSLVYPPGGWNEDVTVYTVDAGQSLEVNIPVDVTIASITAPLAVDSVTREETGSVYSVVGSDGESISAQEWTRDGGFLSVAIGEDQHSLDVVIIGAGGSTSEKAPFRIGMSVGPNDYYSSLRVNGNGTHFKRESIIVPTGADASVTAREVGVNVDNLFVATKQQAQSLALDVASKWASPTRVINIQRAVISAPGDGSTGQYDYATFADFDAYAAANSITTFAQFDSAWSGQTFAQFDNYWFELVDDQFAFQVFGNANGARIQFRRAIYRIRNIQISESTVSYTAEADTTFADFDTSAGAMTFAQFDTSYTGLTFQDFSLVPLPTVKPEYDR
jgi:hypothetical protein